MTRTDLPGLRDALRDLLGRDPDEVALRRYYAGLDDVPLTDIRHAISDLLRTWRGTRHPWPADIRAVADRARTQSALRTAWQLERHEAYHCEACGDTGWLPTTRDAAHVYGAGRTVPAVRRCGCSRTNPVVRAHYDGMRRIGQEVDG